MAARASIPMDPINCVRSARKRKLQQLYVEGSRKRVEMAAGIDLLLAASAEEGSGDSWDDSVPEFISAKLPSLSPAMSAACSAASDELDATWQSHERTRRAESPASVSGSGAGCALGMLCSATTATPSATASAATTAPAQSLSPALTRNRDGANTASGPRAQQMHELSELARHLDFAPRELLCAVLLHDMCHMAYRAASGGRQPDTVQRHVLSLTATWLVQRTRRTDGAVNADSTADFCAKVSKSGASHPGAPSPGAQRSSFAVKGCMLERQAEWVCARVPRLAPVLAINSPHSPPLDALIRALWSILRLPTMASRARHLAAFTLCIRALPFGREKLSPAVVAAAADVATRGAKSQHIDALVCSFVPQVEACQSDWLVTVGDAGCVEVALEDAAASTQK